MATTVKAPRNFGIDEQIAALRLQAMAGETAKRFGQRMRQRRVELKLTQKQVAARFSSDAVDGQRISDWERAYNEPSDRYKEEIVEALDVPDISYFYEPPENPGESPLQVFSGNGDGSTEAERLARIEQRLTTMEEQLGELLGYRREAQEQLRNFDVEDARELLNLLQEAQARQGRDAGKRALRSRVVSGR